jgi:hypothetical protein
MLYVKKEECLGSNLYLLLLNFLVQSSGFDLNHNKKAFKKYGEEIGWAD